MPERKHDDSGTSDTQRSDQLAGEKQSSPEPVAEAAIEDFEQFLIDEAGMETFPASDPPSWTPLIIMGHGHHRPAPAEPLEQPAELPEPKKTN